MLAGPGAEDEDYPAGHGDHPRAHASRRRARLVGLTQRRAIDAPGSPRRVPRRASRGRARAPDVRGAVLPVEPGRCEPREGACARHAGRGAPGRQGGQSPGNTALLAPCRWEGDPRHRGIVDRNRPTHNGKQARLSKEVNWRSRVSGGIPPAGRGPARVEWRDHPVPDIPDMAASAGRESESDSPAFTWLDSPERRLDAGLPVGDPHTPTDRELLLAQGIPAARLDPALQILAERGLCPARRRRHRRPAAAHRAHPARPHAGAAGQRRAGGRRRPVRIFTASRTGDDDAGGALEVLLDIEHVGAATNEAVARRRELGALPAGHDRADPGADGVAARVTPRADHRGRRTAGGDAHCLGHPGPRDAGSPRRPCPPAARAARSSGR